MQRFCDIENREAKEIAPGVSVRTFWGAVMLMSVVDFAADAAVPNHRHPQEQAGAVLAGEIELTIDGESRQLKAGDTYLVPGNVEHAARTGDVPARVLDIFSSLREDLQY